MYSSPGRRSADSAPEGNDDTDPPAVEKLLVDEAMLPVRDLSSAGSEDCIGSPISVAELVLLPFVEVPTCVARLNICGIRAREREDEVLPSGGWICWNDSNSRRRALSVRRYSSGFEVLSRIAGNERPNKR
jgi:hypothetical protein